ncbi:MAG: polysaccharide biosynthesis protein [Candidatus Krumholzibacteriia bacterium]
MEPHSPQGRFLSRLRSSIERHLGERRPASRVLRSHRLIVTLAFCSLMAAVSWTAACVVRFELSVISQRYAWTGWWLASLGLVVPLRLIPCLLFGLHRGSWRYAGARDVLPVTGAVTLGSLLIALATRLVDAGPGPRSVLVIDLGIALSLMIAARYAFRLGHELLAALGASGRRKVIVVGAGAAGRLTIRALLDRDRGGYWPVLILDDDPLKQGTTILGVPVAGPVELVGDAARRSRAEAIVLAVPGVRSSDLYRIVRHCRAAGLPLKTVPDLAQILAGTRSVASLTDFRTEDLLSRRPILADAPRLRAFLSGRRVLVTGAAGSIGSELCRQIADQSVAALVCLDRDENGLFRLEQELRTRGGDAARLHYFLGDARDRRRMAELFDAHEPEIVFHAAAYKHVPVLQYHPTEAVRNNVGGTRNLVELADARGVGTFVLISTDKAVNPTSVMGATKRVAEHLVRSHSRSSTTRFGTIRFGNVLGSNGSVVELFLKQIREGRPVTVTDPRMERYFMTIAEAVQLVLFAGAMTRGGETFILDMGEPVLIDQLARQMIQLSGLVPDVDVPIVYSGLRPGEKLSEELWTRHETPGPTGHPGIMVAPRNGFQVPDLDARVGHLLAAAEMGQLEVCWELLLGLVPTFQGEPPVGLTDPRPAAAGADRREPDLAISAAGRSA